MKIWFVSSLSGHGGVATYIRALSAQLAQGGHSLTWLTAARANPEALVSPHLRLTTLPISYPHRIARLPIVGRYVRGLYHWQYSRQVARLLTHLPAADQPDLLEFADIGGEAFTYLRLKTRRPVVVRAHTPTFVLRQYHLPAELPGHTGLTTHLERASLTRADAVTAPSQAMAAEIARYLPDLRGRIAPIPNPLGPEWTGLPLPQPAGPEFRILQVGRLERIKGVAIAARALPQIAARLPEMQYVFVGPDRPAENGRTWQAQLSAQFSGPQWHNRVLVHGYLSPAELLAWYARAHLAAVPTLNYESFSYTAAQASAAGLPVVATAIGGIPETILDGTSGLLVPPGDPTAFSSAILTLAQDPALRQRLGQTGQDHVRRNFAVAAIAPRMLALYAAAQDTHVSR